MKPVDVKSSRFIDFGIKNNEKDPEFKISDQVRILKYKSSFPNYSEENFAIKIVKNTVPWTYVISVLNGKEVAGTFYKKEFQKTNQTEFRIQKVIKQKVDKLYVKLERLW